MNCWVQKRKWLPTKQNAKTDFHGRTHCQFKIALNNALATPLMVMYIAQKVVVCVLLSLLLLSFFAPIYAKSASASKVSAEWGALNTANPRYSNELLWESTICNEIANMFANSGSWSNINNYNSLTPNDVYAHLSYVDEPSSGVDWSTTWWVGDFSHPFNNQVPAPFGYFGCYTTTPNSYVWDYEIYNRATANGVRSSKNYFTFMWTCANGGLYWNPTSATLSPYRSVNGYYGYYDMPGIISPIYSLAGGNPPQLPSGTATNSNNHYGYRVNASHIVGMPYAWTGRTDMSLNGYVNPSGSYTFIGWENSSPFMIDTPPSSATSTNLSYLFFVYYFYRYALGYDNNGTHGTINEALDYAAQMTFGQNYTFGTSILYTGQWMNNEDFAGFANLWFYCRLRVFGKGNMILPY